MILISPKRLGRLLDQLAATACNGQSRGKGARVQLIKHLHPTPWDFTISIGIVIVDAFKNMPFSSSYLIIVA